MRQLVIGILAHVDAGKTTLSESMLYLSGRIRKAGRVDHGDAYLDTYEIEKERGITIFSKQAWLEVGDTHITLLDTPGHVDFSAEMERTLQVLDYAILVISGADGVQGHTRTLWKLLERYQIPTFLFINKMDQEGTDQGKLLRELKEKLGDGCVDFDREKDEDAFLENVAVCEEALLERFLAEGSLSDEDIREQIRRRRLFPCCFGSALRQTGVKEFMDTLVRYTQEPVYPDTFGAKVFKIARDEKGNRLTYLKVTGGRLQAKMSVGEEKADQIRIYSGARFETVQEAFPGAVCAVTGLTMTRPGQGLGYETDAKAPFLMPVLNYRILLPADCDVHRMLRSLRELEEEDPMLRIVWDEHLQEIHAMLMGDVQIDVLKRLIWERFHVAADLDTGNVVYKETIANAVEGVGHFEPLRHYAEVHLLLEPGERGSGLQFFTACSEDVLDRNWQRLILTHLMEKEHRGVLTGSPVTDLQITLLTGRAHLKHTEGGDFRQATYRAVRQGLMKARSVLLEPVYEFTMELPADCVGRAMTDIQKMQGSIGLPEQEGETAVLTGTVPVSKMRTYTSQFTAYTRGLGHLTCALKGYEPCPDQDEIVKEMGYDPERDLDNPTGSVFCAHGAGFVVPWYQVEQYMHLETQAPETEETDPEMVPSWTPPGRGDSSDSYADEKELQAIFERTFGPVKSRLPQEYKRVVSAPSEYRPKRKNKPAGDEYLLVDGYNMIFAWEELRSLAQENIHAAQDRLKDILANYQGLRQCTVILVFDAYKVEGHKEEIFQYHNIYVVFTKEAETADQYIEKTVHRIGRNNRVTVATSDGLEQIIILGQGAVRMSARGLLEEIRSSEEEMRNEWREKRRSSNHLLGESMPDGLFIQNDNRNE